MSGDCSLGTDSAVGKRTTATILTKALCDKGLNAVMVATGQTGLIQGANMVFHWMPFRSSLFPEKWNHQYSMPGNRKILI